MIARLAVTAAEIDAYERDGVVLLREVIPPEWVARLQAGIAEAMASPPPKAIYHRAKLGETAFYSEHGSYRRLPVFREFAPSGPTRAIAAAMMKSEKLNLYTDHIFVKEAGAGAPTPWHQDLPYWRFKGHQVASLWIALDVVDSDNGGVDYVRGSHQGEKLYRPVEFGDDAKFDDMTFDRVPDIEARRSEFDIVNYELAPGDGIFFHARTLHGAPANVSKRARRALSVRYCGDDVVFHEWPGLPPAPFSTESLRPGDSLDESDIYPRIWPE